MVPLAGLLFVYSVCALRVEKDEGLVILTILGKLMLWCCGLDGAEHWVQNIIIKSKI